MNDSPKSITNANPSARVSTSFFSIASSSSHFINP